MRKKRCSAAVLIDFPKRALLGHSGSHPSTPSHARNVSCETVPNGPVRIGKQRPENPTLLNTLLTPSPRRPTPMDGAFTRHPALHGEPARGGRC
jgi:hypothetical protein